MRLLRSRLPTIRQARKDVEHATCNGQALRSLRKLCGLCVKFRKNEIASVVPPLLRQAGSQRRRIDLQHA